MRADGPAITAAFLRWELERVLDRLGVPLPAPRPLAALLSRPWFGTAIAGTAAVTAALRDLLRVAGYGDPADGASVTTREGVEPGGRLATAPGGGMLRVWAVAGDLDGSARFRRRWREAPARAALRVLRATRDRAGVITNGRELRLLIADPALPDSHLALTLPNRPGRAVPDGLRLILRLISPAGIAALPAVLDAARLHQARVTEDLRRQARAALEAFLQAVLDQPLAGVPSAEALWRDGLVLVSRLLFVLKCEADPDPARAFGFAGSALWTARFSPQSALAPLVRRHLDHGHDTGSLLEAALRQLFRALRDGIACAELCIAPLGGALFGPEAMPVLERLPWGDRAVALLLDHLMWTPGQRGGRERVQYGTLDIAVLGQVYEALLDLEPVIADRPMIRLRRAGHEAVVPAPPDRPDGAEVIPPGRFLLRAGHARKTSGSYYTDAAFVRLLVEAALAPACRDRSPEDDPDPGAILSLRVLDPATGSGHFLVVACRFLGAALFDACRACERLASAPGTSPARAAILRARLAMLPDPDGLLRGWLAALPEGGIAEARARALCRRLVAIHCLYGADRNVIATGLAKLALWIEAHAEGLPLTFLDHRLVAADSLTGPAMADLHRLPVGGQPLDPLLARGITDRLAAMHAVVTAAVRRIGATLGRDLADLALKEAAQRDLEAARAPLLNLARAWSGAAMLGGRAHDDEWLALARAVTGTGAWPAVMTTAQQAMLAAGADALSWDLAFPEVAGFDAVIGNPPWDVLQYSTRDFLARHDPAIRDATAGRERAAIAARVLADPETAAAFCAYRAGFDRPKRIAARLYRHQSTVAAGSRTSGNPDLFKLFAERAMQLCAPRGTVGLLLPSAFHANEGTTALRRLYLDNGLALCLSFENRRGFFPIDSRFKFALVLARRGTPAAAVRCAFYLDTIAAADDPDRVMIYDRAFIEAAGGSHLTLPELRGPRDLAIARRLFAAAERFGPWCAGHGIRFGRELHMTEDAHRFAPIAAAGTGPGWLAVHEGKTIHQFTDCWEAGPRLAVRRDALADRPRVLATAEHFRMGFRDVARSNDERSAIATLLPPGVVSGHTVTVERAPERRTVVDALALCAVFNAFCFDWLVRQKAAAHVSLYLLDGLPMPALDRHTTARLAHIAALLCASGPRFAPLLAAADAAAAPPPDAAARARLRAEADALVAHAYGLARADYAHVLGSFSHASWPEAPHACLTAFDAAG